MKLFRNIRDRFPLVKRSTLQKEQKEVSELFIKLQDRNQEIANYEQTVGVMNETINELNQSLTSNGQQIDSLSKQNDVLHRSWDKTLEDYQQMTQDRDEQKRLLVGAEARLDASSALALKLGEKSTEMRQLIDELHNI